VTEPIPDREPPPSSEALGAAVRRLRQDRGLKQRELSAASSVNTSYLSDIERGRRNPTWVSLGRICTALDVRMSDLARLAEELARGDGALPHSYGHDPRSTPG
jgi:transcriptional regulator with XRE-family HTH domain